MKWTVAESGALRKGVDTLILFQFKKEGRPLGPVGEIDPKLADDLAEAAKLDLFEAGQAETIVFTPKRSNAAKRVIAAGLGERASFEPDRLRRAAGRAAAKARAAKARSLAVLLPAQGGWKPALGEAAHIVIEGIGLSLYRFDRYLTKEKTRSPDATTLVAPRGRRAEVEEGARRGQVYLDATCLVRDFVNEPASVMTPRRLAEEAAKIVRASRGALTLKVLDEKRIEKAGMGALRAVSMGSAEPPRFVHMAYRAPGARKTVAILGKGITFDAGGLCLKNTEGMLNMKDDMAGAALTIALAQALPRLRPRINVHLVFAATENMPGGRAFKMRDVLKTFGGKTIEVHNTDAEGRLILADALGYAGTLKADAIFDVATLTSAIRIALGHEMAGLFTNDDKLADAFLAAARDAGERFWRMPLIEEYKEMIRTDMADVRNATGTTTAGSITAALFLREFVPPKTPWVHLDIAGVAYRESAEADRPAGGTGAGVRALLRFLEKSAR